MLFEWELISPVCPRHSGFGWNSSRRVSSLGHGFYPEDAVRTAAELVAEGIDVDGLVQLASQPADLKVIDGQHVEILFRSALAEVGLEPPSREAAGWTLARWIAARIVGRVIPPGEGALGNLRLGRTALLSRSRFWASLPRS